MIVILAISCQKNILQPCEQVLWDKIMNKVLSIWFFQDSFIGFQKFFLFQVALRSYNAIKLKSEGVLCLCVNLVNRQCDIQLRADAMVHLKYWFLISLILERTKNSTKTNNTSFERSDSGLFKSWRLGAWHSYWPAMPTLCDKLNFLGEEGVASPWCCYAPVLQEIFWPLSGLSNEILYVYVPFLLLL